MRAVIVTCVLLTVGGVRAEAQPQFNLRQNTFLIDEPIPIVVSGLTPGAEVVIALAAPQWSSSATFITDPQGVVDLTRMAPKPKRGDYTGVDAMGLFWSARQDAPGERRSTNEAWELTPAIDGKVVANANVMRRAVAADVTMTSVRDRGLSGVFYQPPGAGRHPAMIVLSGSGGGTPPPSSFPGGLASRGYAVLALAYFGVEGLPRSLHNIPLEYFGTALEWLSAQPSVDPERIGVLGISRGGELALLLGSIYPQIRTVVAYLPSNVVWGGCCDRQDEGSWTLGGRDVAWVQPRRADRLDMMRAAIQVEKIHGAVLLISGRKDEVWHSTEMSESIVDRLRRNHFPFAYEHLAYDDAGHGIGRPYTSTMDINHVTHPQTGRVMSFGGTPAGTAKAREDSWRRMLEFVDKHLNHYGS